MVNLRINVFENFPGGGNLRTGSSYAASTLSIQGVYIPGSISFNNIAIPITASGTTAKTLTISFGLYSLNGNTLSLANSASGTTSPVANQCSWVTLATSATQDITPGNWYFGFLGSYSNTSRISFLVNGDVGGLHTGTYNGLFVRGRYSVTTEGLPESIATANLSKEVSDTGQYTQVFPYVIISA